MHYNVDICCACTINQGSVNFATKTPATGLAETK